MEKLNLGVSLTNVPRFATARGVQTSPMIALISKSFANIGGCVRYLAPSLPMVEVFEGELTSNLLAMTRDLLSQNRAVRTVVESLLAASEVPHAARTLIADIIDKDVTLPVPDARRQHATKEDRADGRSARRDRSLVVAARAGAWALGRRR